MAPTFGKVLAAAAMLALLAMAATARPVTQRVAPQNITCPEFPLPQGLHTLEIIYDGHVRYGSTQSAASVRTGPITCFLTQACLMTSFAVLRAHM